MSRPGLALCCLALTVPAPADNEAPAIQHDPPACGAPAARLRACAYVVDDTGIAQVKLYFRPRGVRAYHWTPMDFDGARYCAWLPAPLPETLAVEYYVEAVDAEFEPSRTADHAFLVQSECPDRAPTPAAAPPAVVGTTTPRQPPAPSGFDPATFKVR